MRAGATGGRRDHPTSSLRARALFKIARREDIAANLIAGRRHVRGRLPRGLLRRLRRAGGGAPGLLKKVVEQPPIPLPFLVLRTRVFDLSTSSPSPRF